MTTSTEARTAVLYDRHPIWLDALERVLAGIGIDVVVKATTPQAALDAFADDEVDLFITDAITNDPAIDGFELIRRVRERAPRLRPIVISEITDTAVMDRAFAAGAIAYVVKTAHPDDLASVVRQAFDHSVFFSPPRPAAPAKPAPVPGRSGAEELTRRELEILRLVAEGHSNAKMAKMLWVTEQTVKFHLSNIYRKLDVANRTEASRFAQVHGLLGDPPPDWATATTEA